MVIWEQERNVQNMSRSRVFSTFLECSQMTGVFYQCNTGLRILHLLYYIDFTRTKHSKTCFFYVLYSDYIIYIQNKHCLQRILKTSGQWKQTKLVLINPFTDYNQTFCSKYKFPISLEDQPGKRLHLWEMFCMWTCFHFMISTALRFCC